MAGSLEFFTLLEKSAQTPVHTNHPLSRECTFRIGGSADYFCAPETAAALSACLQTARQQHVPIFILGGGSNVLFADEGFSGLVLSTSGLNRIQRTETGVTVGAGAANASLTQFTCQHGLSGFEWACGLPGTVGGGVYMNAKCYCGAFGDMVESVSCLDHEGRELSLPAAECDFTYKHSIFQHNGYVITEVRLKLTPGDPATIRAASEANRQDRIRKGQFNFPSAGCAFKNAHALNAPAGKLIEDCGLKGRTIGGAAIYEQHANFIINQSNAKAADVVALMELAKQAVWEKYKFRLEEEIRVIS